MSAIQKLLEENLQLPVMMAAAESFLSILVPVMEDSFRKVVKEELDLATERIVAEVKRLLRNETLTPEEEHLALKFIGRVRQPIYTGEDIKGEGEGENSIVQVALVDADEKIITSGPEASSRVEILVIPDHDEGSQRPPVISKNNQLQLKEGVAVLNNMKFRNKSEWTIGCRIKLLARTIGNITEERLRRPPVKDATSEPFLVLDRRGLHSKKHEVPVLSDEVWRLKGIPKKGKLRELLRKEKINSVKDFLICHNTEPQRLQKILGIKTEKLAGIVDHAKTCKISENQHIYNSPCSQKRNITVVFDDVGCVRGLINEEQQFVSVDYLSEDQKAEANKMVKSAFQNWKNVKSYYHNEASASVIPSQVPNDPHPSNLAATGIPTVYYPEPVDGQGPDYATDQPIVTSDMDFPDDLWLSDYGCSWEPAEAQALQSENFSMIEPGANYEEFSADHVSSPSKAKGRWKLVIMTLKFMSMRKRILLAPLEDNHTSKRQRRDY